MTTLNSLLDGVAIRTSAPTQPILPTLSARPDRNGRTWKIILAEDNLIKRKVTTSYVTRAGINFDLYTPENGYDAVMTAKAVNPHFVFMDIMMPCVEGIADGVQAAREIRRAGITAPIVAVSANSGEDSYTLEDQTMTLAEACRAVGMNEFYSVPMKAEAGIQIIKKYLNPLTEEGKTRV